jgi:hypothetical protein
MLVLLFKSGDFIIGEGNTLYDLRMISVRGFSHVLDASKFIAERLGKPESVSVVNHWEQKKRVH